MSSLPVDDIALVYGRADATHKNAVTEILSVEHRSFLLSTEGGYTVVAGSNLDKSAEMFAGLVVQLEREYGKAFTRALMVLVLSRLTPDEIKELIRARFKGGDPT